MTTTRPVPPNPADDIEDRDPGLARERTDLAWTRTAISFAALGTAMLRDSAAAGLLVMVCAVAVWGLGQLIVRDAAPGRSRSAHGRTLALITAVTVLASLLALVLAVLTPDP